jgi:hypothetical protein
VTPEQCRAVIATMFWHQRHPSQLTAIALMQVAWPWYPPRLLFVLSDFSFLILVRHNKEAWL